MCPHKHWFVTCEKKSGGNVLMGNDAPCKSVGIGYVQIKMHDGCGRDGIIVLLIFMGIVIFCGLTIIFWRVALRP